MFYDLLREHKLVVIIRGINKDDIIPVTQALYNGGIRLVEVTMNTPKAAEMISILREKFKDDLLVGAGTVIDEETTIEAIEAGAQFLITPNLDEDVIKLALRKGVEILPGVMTPTEVVKAKKAGAEMVKLFPVASLGAKYVKELMGPLGDIPLVAVGGVNIENVTSFLDAGAVGVGVGGSVIEKEAIKLKNYEALRVKAQKFIEVMTKGGTRR